MKTELEELISILEGNLAELKPAAAPVPVKKPSPPPVKEKWSKENHPAYQAGYRKPTIPQEEPEKNTNFQVNDTVLAKWKSGDKGMYPAKITSITGSSSKPIYIVRFKAAGDQETLFAHELKAMSNDSRKRKADGTPATPTTPSVPANPSIISAAASIDPTLASQAKKEPSKVSDGPPRPAKVPRKVKANKELEAGKSKWQDFTAKGRAGKVAKKDSMFRTGEGVNARGKPLLVFSFDLSLTCVQLDSLVLARPCAKTLRGADTFTILARTRKGIEEGSGYNLWGIIYDWLVCLELICK